MIMARYKINIGWSLLIAYILLIAIAIMCVSSCGVRNVGTSKESSKESVKEKESSKSDVKKETESSEERTSKETTDKTDEKQDTKVTEKFNPDGSLNERTTETSSSKSTDKSIKDIHSRREFKTTIDSTITNKIYRAVVITETKKDKEVKADKSVVTNFGGPWSLLAGIIIVTAAVFLYYYLKRRKSWPTETK